MHVVTRNIVDDSFVIAPEGYTKQETGGRFYVLLAYRRNAGKDLTEQTRDNDGEFVYKECPEIQQAATVRFSVPFNVGYDAASEKLTNWMEKHEYVFADPLRGHVIVSPDENSNPDNWLTEFQAPVEKK